MMSRFRVSMLLVRWRVLVAGVCTGIERWKGLFLGGACSLVGWLDERLAGRLSERRLLFAGGCHTCLAKWMAMNCHNRGGERGWEWMGGPLWSPDRREVRLNRGCH